MNRNGAALEMDAVTARSVEHLARVWGVSTSEVIRRAVAQAEVERPVVKKQERLTAFKELQRRLALTPAKAAEWEKNIREARR